MQEPITANPISERRDTVRALADALAQANEEKARSTRALRALLARETPVNRATHDRARTTHQRAVAARNALYDAIQALPDGLRREVLSAARG